MVPVAAERRRRRAPVGNRHVRAVTAVDHHHRRIQPAHARDHRRRRERRRAVHVGPSLEHHHRRRRSFVDRVRPTLERDVVVVARQPARPDPVRPRVGRHDHRWPIARRWLAGEVERQRPTQDARAFSVHEPAVAHVESRVRVAVGLGLVVRRYRQRSLVHRQTIRGGVLSDGVVRRAAHCERHGVHGDVVATGPRRRRCTGRRVRDRGLVTTLQSHDTAGEGRERLTIELALAAVRCDRQRRRVDRIGPALERDVVVVARQAAWPDGIRPRVHRCDRGRAVARRRLTGEVEHQRPAKRGRALAVHEPAVAHVEPRVRVAVGLGLVVRRHRQRGLVDVDEDVLRRVVEVPCIRRREINVQVLTRASVQHCPGRRVVGKGPGYRGVLERRCCVELRAVDGGAVRDVAGIRPVDRRCRLVHDQRAAASA